MFGCLRAGNTAISGCFSSCAPQIRIDSIFPKKKRIANEPTAAIFRKKVSWSQLSRVWPQIPNKKVDSVRFSLMIVGPSHVDFFVSHHFQVPVQIFKGFTSRDFSSPCQDLLTVIFESLFKSHFQVIYKSHQDPFDMWCSSHFHGLVKIVFTSFWVPFLSLLEDLLSSLFQVKKEKESPCQI